MNWRESSNDTELTAAKSNMTQETNDDELRKDTSDDNELYTSDDDEDDDMINDMANGYAPAEMIEFITSERVRVPRYLDDVVFYKDVNEEEETTQSYVDFIDTDEILNGLMPSCTVPEAPEIVMTENNTD